MSLKRMRDEATDKEEEEEKEKEKRRRLELELEEAQSKKKKKDEDEDEDEDEPLEDDDDDSNGANNSEGAKKLAEELARPPHPKATIWMHLPHKQPLQTLLENISVLRECPFSFVLPGHQRALTGTTLHHDSRVDVFSGLYLEVMDTSQSCMLIAKLAAQVFVSKASVPTATDMHFCVNVKRFLTHVKAIDGAHCVVVYRVATSNDLFVKPYSPLAPGHNTGSFSLRTLPKAPTTFTFTNMSYPHSVDFNMTVFKNIVGLAKNVNSDLIRLRLLQDRNAPTGSRRSWFLIHVHADDSYREWCFGSATDMTLDHAGTSTIVIREGAGLEYESPNNLPFLEDLDEIFNQVYKVDYISSFIKGLDRRMISMRMAQDMPITFTADLGDAHSFLTYVVTREAEPNLANTLQSFPSKTSSSSSSSSFSP